MYTVAYYRLQNTFMDVIPALIVIDKEHKNVKLSNCVTPSKLACMTDSGPHWSDWYICGEKWEDTVQYVCVSIPTWASCPEPWHRWSSSAGPGCGWSPAGNRSPPQCRRQHLRPAAEHRTDLAPTRRPPCAARCPSAAPGRTPTQTSHQSTAVRPRVKTSVRWRTDRGQQLPPPLPKLNKGQIWIINY